MSVFSSGLQLAHNLQLMPASSDSTDQQAATSGIQAATYIVTAHKQLCSALQQQHALQEQQSSKQLSSEAALHSRQATLDAASSMMSTILDNQDTIAERLRANRIRPCIPIHHDQQHHLSAVLKGSAQGPTVLAAGASALQWAAGLDCQPAIWEDTLQPLVDAKKACTGHAEVLQKFSQQLTR